MFRPVPMLQLSALVLARDTRAVLKDWGRHGTVQLLPQPAGLEATALRPTDTAGNGAKCERLLGELEALCQSLAIAELPRGGATPEAFTLEVAEQQLRSLTAGARKFLEQRERLNQRWTEAAALDARVSPYRGLELPLQAPEQFGFLHFVTGSLPAGTLEQLQVGEAAVLLALEPERQQGAGEPRARHRLLAVRARMAALGRETRPTAQHQRERLVAITTREKRAALEQALAEAGFEPEPLPAMAGATADSLCEKNRREQDSLQAELEQLDTQMRRLAAELAAPLAALQRGLQTERRLLEAEQTATHSEAAVLLSGWVPATEAPALERRLRQITGNRCVLQSATPEQVPEEQVPVLLQHPRLLRPFERLVTGYGLPQYREVEPTLFVALSYLVMFGMMFGDVGQGAVLAVGGLLGWRLGRSGKLREAGQLLLFGGLFSMGFGLLYGSYFGLPGLSRYALWHAPLEGDPLSLMRLAIGLGVAVLSLGLLLNVVNRFRHGDVLGGFLDKFGVLGVLFYWGMLALLTNYAAMQSRGLVRPALLLCFVLPVAGWTLKGLLEYARRRRSRAALQPGEGLWTVLAESAVEAFEGLLSYLANTVSFVRLAAYALSHAALLMATFLLAAQVQRASRTGAVLVIILGNLGVIALEGVVASVQALRLEYYEFFSKFFSGAGRAFAPFRLPTEAEAL